MNTAVLGNIRESMHTMVDKKVQFYFPIGTRVVNT
jgi:hypothetical protein